MFEVKGNKGEDATMDRLYACLYIHVFIFAGLEAQRYEKVGRLGGSSEFGRNRFHGRNVPGDVAAHRVHPSNLHCGEVLVRPTFQRQGHSCCCCTSPLVHDDSDVVIARRQRRR